MIDGLKQPMIVGLEGVQGADAAALELARLFQGNGELAKPRAIVHGTEGVPITLVGFLRNFSAPVQVGHATPHPQPP
jgi:hypothetical protein